MKGKALLVYLVLAFALAMPVFAGGKDDKGEKPSSHQVTGVLEGTLLFVPFPNASAPFDIDTLGDATGVARSLGRANMFTFHRPLPDGSGVMNGLVRIVTAGSGTLMGHYAGTTEWGEEPNQIIGRVDLVITGGTGRFEDAKGTIHATSYVTSLGFDVFEWPVTWVLEGTVDY